MRKGRSNAPKTPKKPADAQAGAVLVRKFAIKLFDRDEGEAANWKLIAETLFKAAFDALDRSPDDASRVALLRRVHTGSYDRLTADPAASETRALALGVPHRLDGPARLWPEVCIVIGPT
jgi:hypothetical protein